MHFRQVFNNGTIPPVLKMITVVIIIIVVVVVCVFLWYSCVYIHSHGQFRPGIPLCLYFTHAGVQVGCFTCSALMWFLGIQTPVVMLM